MSSITFRPMRSVDLGSADGPAERALDHHQRALAEERGDLLEELVDVGRAEVLELRRTDLRIDPVPGLAWPVMVCIVCSSRSMEASQSLTHCSTE